MFVTQIRVDAEVTGYAAQLPVTQHLKHMGGLQLRAPVTVIVGDNGAGKSTLLEAIAVAMNINPEGGTKALMNFNYAETESQLGKALTISRAKNPPRSAFLRAETFFNFATEFRRNAAVDPMLHERSHGEGVLKFLESLWKKPHFMLFDEPEAGLSAIAQMALLAQIYHAAEAGSQFIIATHSAILPAIPGADIVCISENGIDNVTYEECESVAATKEFLNNPHETAKFICRTD